MIEPKVRLSLKVPGAKMLSSQVCEQNPQESYNETIIYVSDIKINGKHKKEVKTPIIIKTRKQELITQNINMSKDAYEAMLETPTSAKFTKKVQGNKRIWDILSINEKLKHHFNLIANDLNAVSYSFEVLDE